MEQTYKRYLVARIYSPGQTVYYLWELKMKLSQHSPDDQDDNSQHSVVNQAFTEVLKNNRLLVACAAGLRQYHLNRKYDPVYVVNEAYIRACQAVDRGKEIKNFPGWIRITCTYIIRELSREDRKRQSRNQQLFPETLPATQQADCLYEQEATPEQLRMKAVFAQLSQLEKDILHLRIVKGLRWKNVQLALINAGYPLISVNTLSQKKRRALQHLKTVYSAIAR